MPTSCQWRYRDSQAPLVLKGINLEVHPHDPRLKKLYIISLETRSEVIITDNFKRPIQADKYEPLQRLLLLCKARPLVRDVQSDVKTKMCMAQDRSGCAWSEFLYNMLEEFL